MPNNVKMIRIQSKLDELFSDMIDVSDAKNDEDRRNKLNSRAIAAFALVMRCGIDFESAAKAITDGYCDMGIDAVYNDSVQKKLVLVQSKWRKDGNGGISQEEVNTFVSGIERIINLELNGCNKKLEAKTSEISAAISDIDYQIEMIFCHTGSKKMNAYVRRPIDTLIKRVNGDDGETELLVFVENKLQDIYYYLTKGQNADNIVIDDFLLYNWGTIDEPYKAFYGTIPVAAIGKWFAQYGNKLFAKNIRFYKGSTEVNQGIKEVLRNEPEKFVYYNNGIKVLCKKITKKALYSTDRNVGIFALEGVSLVNGAQTAGTIGAIYAESPEVLSSARVYIQIIDLGEANEDQAIKITKLSNTQNKIEGKDFASLDPNQERLRLELSLEGIQYLYKSGAKLDSPERQISLDEAIVAQACSLDDLSITALAKRNVGALTENIEKTPYKLLFNDSTDSFSLYNNVLVLRAVEDCISKNEPNVTGRKRLVLVHGNRYLLHIILGRVQQTEGFTTRYMDTEETAKIISPIFLEVWEEVYDAMEKHFSEAYPAHVFKNVGRLKVIES